MAYAQWIILQIISRLKNGTISVKNAGLSWGKFYQPPNKDAEIDAGTVNKITIAPKSSAEIGSCGREDASSGTEGQLDLYDGDTKICHVYWDCPWGSKNNTLQVSGVTPGGDYFVNVGSWNPNSGAIGEVTLEVGNVA
ncbi:hypothetical protein VTH82DRAFT_1661 [Thermothelomyces myriococcoides]